MPSPLVPPFLSSRGEFLELICLYNTYTRLRFRRFKRETETRWGGHGVERSGGGGKGRREGSDG